MEGLMDEPKEELLRTPPEADYSVDMPKCKCRAQSDCDRAFTGLLSPSPLPDGTRQQIEAGFV